MSSSSFPFLREKRLAPRWSDSIRKKRGEKEIPSFLQHPLPTIHQLSLSFSAYFTLASSEWPHEQSLHHTLLSLSTFKRCQLLDYDQTQTPSKTIDSPLLIPSPYPLLPERVRSSPLRCFLLLNYILHLPPHPLQKRMHPAAIVSPPSSHLDTKRNRVPSLPLPQNRSDE